MQKIVVGEDQARQRADVLACEKLPSISRAYIQKLFGDGRITINDELQKPGYRMRLGDTMTINFEPVDLDQIPDIDLPIIYQDDQVVVINKPTGVISHSRGKYWDEPSVASFVRQLTGQEGERAGIVHRLDRATSGVMICAKTSEALKTLQKQFSDRTVKKTYRAVVAGHMKQPEAIIDMPIERDPKQPQTFRVGAQGKASSTQYKVIAESQKYSLLELTPKTGRTHQLRVHLEELGHPIVGDTLYDGEAADRLMLHAFSLEITLPSSERKVFSADEPDEFKQLLGS